MGLFGKPAKKISINELDSKVSESTIKSDFAINEIQALNKRLKIIQESLDSLNETKNIPSEWVNQIRRMQEYNPELPDISVIYSVLMAYKNLNQVIAKSNQDRTKERLSAMKQEIVSKNIHNCNNCGKPLIEGEYYKVGDKFYCLSHSEEDSVQIATGDESL